MPESALGTGLSRGRIDSADGVLEAVEDQSSLNKGYYSGVPLEPWLPPLCMGRPPTRVVWLLPDPDAVGAFELPTFFI